MTVLSDQKTKYELIKEYIIDHIKNNNLHYNDPIDSEAELMERFQVSRHTVRRGISDLVNEGWLYKQQGKGTFVSDPRANMVSRGKMVGVITTYINDYIFPDIISGAEAEFSEHGYSMILGNTNNNVEKERLILSNMLNNNLAGLLVEPTKSVFPNYNKDLYDQLKSNGVPVLFIHGAYQNVEANYIMEDDKTAGEIATDHLIQAGHKKIAGIFKQDDMQGHNRYEGFMQAKRRFGLEIKDDHVLWYTTESKEDLFKDLEKTKKLLDENTSIVVYNDQIATELLSVAAGIGKRVPEDFSIVSFDNSNLAVINDLTSVAHPKKELGISAAKSLLAMMQDKKSKINVVMKPELVVRSSVNTKNV